LLVTSAAGDFADALRARGVAVEPRGRSPIALLERTGVLRAAPLLIHCVRADEADLRSIAEHHCTVAHCPASNAKLGHGFADVAGMLERGIPVGLGSDSVASNNRMDILDEARLASLFGRVARGRWDAMPAAQVLALATIGGARALGLDAEIGTLEEGKAADLSAFPLDGLHAQPVQDPESALVFATSGRGASFVAVEGEVRVKDGRLVRDVSDDRGVVRAAAEDLRRFGGGA
jgi:5-methylthioadenosine/S-adenosylhomocysteine deaminase